jgi:hypothetical protein
LTLLDVSDPSNPKLRLTTEQFGGGFALEMRGNLACFAAGRALILIDLTDPDHPTEIGRYEEPEGIDGIHLLDDKVYVGAYVGSYTAQRIIDISDPTQPRLIGSAPLRPLLIGRSGQYACSFAGGLSIIDLKAPANPQSMSYTRLTTSQNIALQGRYAILSSPISGIKTVDIADSARPAIRSEFLTLQSNVFVTRKYAYTVGPSFRILDISDPLNPLFLSSLAEPGRGLVVVGKYAYVAGNPNEFLTVINVTNARAPFVVRRVPGFGTALAASNGYLYSTRLNGAAIFDLADPSSPRKVGEFTGLGEIFQNDIAANDSLLFMVGGGGFQVIDVSDPKHPWQIGQLDLVTGTRLTVSGHRVYVLTVTGGVQVIDVTQPGNPRIVAGNATLSANALAASDDTLYAAGSQGLTILDLFHESSHSQSLTMLSPIDPNAARLRLRGPSGETARIQRSTDFREWTDWQTVPLGDVPQDFRDQELSAPTKFYRTVAP